MTLAYNLPAPAGVRPAGKSYIHDFIAVDVETANCDRASICAIGIVAVEDEEIVDRWRRLVNPEQPFDPFNTEIHGIHPKMVADAPTFPGVYAEVERRFEDALYIAAHSHFDRSAIRRACAAYDLPVIRGDWLDTVEVSRVTHPDLPTHGLGAVAGALGLEFKHHDPLEDAHACAEIIIRSGKDAAEWAETLPVRETSQVGYRSRRGEGLGAHIQPDIEADPDLDLADENGRVQLCFTGRMKRQRSELERLARLWGFGVARGVSGKTTAVVVGVQLQSAIGARYTKSSKHRQAEKLNAAGAKIAILSEADFMERIAGEPR